MIQPSERIQRMRRMFAKNGGIFLEDYEFFTRQPLPDAPTPLNKAPRKSVKPHGRQAPAQN